MRENEQIVCMYSEGRESLQHHAHNTHELVYVQEGRAQFHIDGATYDVGAGTILFISKLEGHSVEIVAEPYRRFWLRLTAAQLTSAADDPRLRAVFDCRPEGFCHALQVGDEAEVVERLLGLLAEECESPQPFGAQRQQAALTLLLILCYRLAGDRFSLPVRHVSEAIPRVQAYIDAHFCEDLSLQDLAARAFLSPSYLSHAFRDWTGHSPKQYVMLCRLSYARELLLTTPEGVEGIAARCGFGDVSNFIRSFRQQTGVTPAVYRREAGKQTTE